MRRRIGLERRDVIGRASPSRVEVEKDGAEKGEKRPGPDALPGNLERGGKGARPPDVIARFPGEGESLLERDSPGPGLGRGHVHRSERMDGRLARGEPAVLPESGDRPDQPGEGLGR